MEGRGFPRAGRAAPRDFPRALPSGNPSEQPCQPSENPVHPSSFNWINPIYSVNRKNIDHWMLSPLNLTRRHKGQRFKSLQKRSLVVSALRLPSPGIKPQTGTLTTKPLRRVKVQPGNQTRPLVRACQGISLVICLNFYLSQFFCLKG